MKYENKYDREERLKKAEYLRKFYAEYRRWLNETVQE
jgi:hypothetical protein|tara:strand:- start:498 stop:608 length:111 start_codon:yes stop_codon:yes gene_type:complete